MSTWRSGSDAKMVQFMNFPRQSHDPTHPYWRDADRSTSAPPRTQKINLKADLKNQRRRELMMKQVSALDMRDPVDQCTAAKLSRSAVVSNSVQKASCDEEYADDILSIASSVASDPTADLVHGGIDPKQFQASLSDLGAYNLGISKYSQDRLCLHKTIHSNDSGDSGFDSSFSRWESSCVDRSLHQPATTPSYHHHATSFELEICEEADDIVDEEPFLAVDNIPRPKTDLYRSPKVSHNSKSQVMFSSPVRSPAPVQVPRNLPSMDSLFPSARKTDQPPTSPRRSPQRKNSARQMVPRRLPSLNALFPEKDEVPTAKTADSEKHQLQVCVQ